MEQVSGIASNDSKKMLLETADTFKSDTSLHVP